MKTPPTRASRACRARPESTTGRTLLELLERATARRAARLLSFVDTGTRAATLVPGR
jgi:hypothetical protein